MCLQTQLQSKLPLPRRSRQVNTSVTPWFTGTLLSHRVENITLQPVFKMCWASYTRIGDTFTVFRPGMHVGAKTIKHCPLLHIYVKVGKDKDNTGWRIKTYFWALMPSMAWIILSFSSSSNLLFCDFVLKWTMWEVTSKTTAIINFWSHHKFLTFILQ